MYAPRVAYVEQRDGDGDTAEAEKHGEQKGAMGRATHITPGNLCTEVVCALSVCIVCVLRASATAASA